MINRKKLIKKHNPVLTKIDTTSPLTVGNGEFAFTVDITGTQSLYQTYLNDHMPLCTMHQWGFFTTPANNQTGRYTQDDVIKTKYNHAGKPVEYMVEKHQNNEDPYMWLRQNPHRANLVRVSLLYKENEIDPNQLTDICQELDLYTGILTSRFCIDGEPVKIITCCHSVESAFGVNIETNMDISVQLSFPYGSPDMSGSDWRAVGKHKTINHHGTTLIERVMDNVQMYVRLGDDHLYTRDQVEEHTIVLKFNGDEKRFTVHFHGLGPSQLIGESEYEHCKNSSEKMWGDFWEKTGIISFEGSTDSRAKELERRLITSLYLSRVQGCGSLPPQETGLTCNSWHGKFHLEMHLWHSGYLALWNNSDLLLKSLKYYKDILPQARKNAAKNGYIGARWPKQVAQDGLDSPSPIATLLVWQQPHIIYMLELIYRQKNNKAFLEEWWDVVKETTDFMCDFLVKDQDGIYNLEAPIIPAQEEHDPVNVKNPTFEIEYFRFGIQTAINWAKKLGHLKIKTDHWQEVADNIAEPTAKEGLYLAHENCPDTFTQFNRDHPSMVAAFGLLASHRIDPEKMSKTLDKILDCWEFETMWGWDFAMMAMTATMVGRYELAIDLILMDSPKNSYVASGNNYQKTRTDLPLYLPGNGSLLLAMPIMIDAIGKCPNWQVQYEGIEKFNM